MAFPKKTILIDGKLHETVGVGVDVFGYDLQKKLGVAFDGVQVPAEKAKGREFWVIVERESRRPVSQCLPTIDEAKKEIQDRWNGAMRKTGKSLEALLARMLELLKTNGGCK